MIRKIKKEDIDDVVDIWLKSSIEFHDFIPASFWESQVENMKNIYIPNSSTYVIKINSEIVGFNSMRENNIEALFIKKEYQSKGLGTELLNHAKNKNEELFLKVYKKNIRAYDFYLINGFVIIDEQIDENTKEEEFKMQFIKR